MNTCGSAPPTAARWRWARSASTVSCRTAACRCSCAISRPSCGWRGVRPAGGPCIRRAQDEILKLLRRIRPPGGIAHAFNGSLQQAEAFIKLGFRLGFGGAMTYTGLAGASASWRRSCRSRRSCWRPTRRTSRRPGRRAAQTTRQSWRFAEVLATLRACRWPRWWRRPAPTRSRPSLGWQPGGFRPAIGRNRDELDDLGLHAGDVAVELLAVHHRHAEHVGVEQHAAVGVRCPWGQAGGEKELQAQRRRSPTSRRWLAAWGRDGPIAHRQPIRCPCVCGWRCKRRSRGRSGLRSCPAGASA